jgi:hypothetical protein
VGHVARIREERKCRRFWWESRKEIDYSEDRGVDGKMGSEWILITLMMEAARTSETSVDIQLRTRHYIPEDSELHTRRRENLKSHMKGECLCPRNSPCIAVRVRERSGQSGVVS